MAHDRSEYVSLIRDSAAAVAPRGGDLARIRALRFSPPGFDPATWREMAALGWIGLRLPEERGGAGVGMTESVALYEELGRGLVPEPLIAATLAATLLAGTDEDVLLARLLSGDALVTMAGANAGLLDVPYVPDQAEAPDLAESFLILDGAALRLVDRDAVSLAITPLQDGGRAATLGVSGAAGRVVAADIGETLDRARDEAALATAAYLLGIAEGAFALTLGYLAQRRQFGQPLASFQALQHRMADLKIQLALSRASVEGAAGDLDAGADGSGRARVVSRAKARAADTALLVGREAVQLHGAIGYTDEYDAGLFLRKAMVTANHYGSAHAHRRRFAALSEPD